MEWKAGRRDVLKLAGLGTASGGLAVRALAGGVERGLQTTLWSFQDALALQLGLPAIVIASALRRLDALDFQPQLMVTPVNEREAEVQASVPFRRTWRTTSEDPLPADLLGRSCALISRDAVIAIRGPEVLFRCTAGCSYGGMTLFLLRSRGAQVALMSNMADAPLIRSLSFKGTAVSV